MFNSASRAGTAATATCLNVQRGEGNEPPQWWTCSLLREYSSLSRGIFHFGQVFDAGHVSKHFRVQFELGL